MRFGIRLIQHLGSPRDIVNLGILADQSGFEQAWFPSDKFMYHAWSIIAALAENTKRIVVGANGTEPYAISPGEIAGFMATLDHLSQGRLAIGFGMHTEKKVGWLGHDTSDRLPRIREAVELMRRLWRGENAKFDGQVYHWSDQCYLRFEPFHDQYFYKEQYDKMIAQCVNLQNGEVDVVELKDNVTVESLASIGYQVLQQKKKKATKVKWAEISGSQVLEEGEWVGKDTNHRGLRR